MTCCSRYQFSENGTDIVDPTFVFDAANGSSGPILPNAALRTNVCFLTCGQKRDKTDGNFLGFVAQDFSCKLKMAP
jgi:hypothetical protein